MFLSIKIIGALAIVGLIIWSLFDSEKGKHRGILIASISFIIGLALFGNFFLESRKAERSLRVVGYASKEFDSDLIKWNLTLQKEASTDGLKEAYRSITKDINDFKEHLIGKGM